MILPLDFVISVCLCKFRCRYVKISIKFLGSQNENVGLGGIFYNEDSCNVQKFCRGGYQSWKKKKKGL